MNEEQPNTQATDTEVKDVPSEQQKQSQLATILIGILVVIAGFLTYNFLQTRQGREATTTTTRETQISETSPSPDVSQKESVYVVKTGDTLSSIAEEIYGNTQNWREIALANNIPLERPIVKVGQELKLPAIGGPETTSVSTTQAPPKEQTQQDQEDQSQQLAQAVEEEVSPTPSVAETPEELDQTPATAVQTYVVKRGDTLWGIAEEVYGDGASWHKIYAANNLSMYSDGSGSEFPLIHAGNVLVIPN